MTPTNNILAFDIETIPNLELLRRQYDKPEGSLAELHTIATQEAIERSEGRSDFLPLVQHEVVAISIVLRTGDQIRVASKIAPHTAEDKIVEGFFGLIDKYSPVLVSWNGTGFDLPVLHLRALRHNLVAEGYWKGPGDKWFQYNSRYHGAHADVMEQLAQHNPRCNTKLELAALNCGLPGKLGYSGSQVFQMYSEERFTEIGYYCEIDALNTYLLWLRLQQLTGALPPPNYLEECTLLEHTLAASKEDHLQLFLKEWLAQRS